MCMCRHVLKRRCVYVRNQGDVTAVCMKFFSNPKYFNQPRFLKFLRKFNFLSHLSFLEWFTLSANGLEA